MNRVLIFILMISSLSVFGQDTMSFQGKRIFIGINVSPDLCYRTITKNDKSLSDEQWAFAKNLEDSIFIPKFGYTVGINIFYQFNKRFLIESGIQYSDKGYKTIPFGTYGILLPENFNDKPTSYISFTYLDFPVKANYLFFNGRIQMIAGVGATLNVLLRSTFRIVPVDKNVEPFFEVSNYPYEKINISPTVSIGINYQLNDKMNFRIEPTYRYGILNIDHESYKATYLWSAGLNLGYYYKLK